MKLYTIMKTFRQYIENKQEAFDQANDDPADRVTPVNTGRWNAKKAKLALAGSYDMDMSHIDDAPEPPPLDARKFNRRSPNEPNHYSDNNRIKHLASLQLDKVRKDRLAKRRLQK